MNASHWRLESRDTLLVVIDIQERLIPHIHESESVIGNASRLIRGCHILDVPTIVTEQYTKGLGSTIDAVRGALDETTGYDPIEKMCFSSYGFSPFAESIRSSGRHSLLLCGIEAHVCVYQTAMDLLEAEYDVHIVADAVSSRNPSNHDLALRRLSAEGARITSTEMALFELCVESGTDRFKAISRLVK